MGWELCENILTCRANGKASKLPCVTQSGSQAHTGIDYLSILPFSDKAHDNLSSTFYEKNANLP